MIPSYLKSLAATVRDLVASGTAVHVTNETAAELDLLAGLPWKPPEHIAVLVHPPKQRIVGITPADIALGWLLLSCAERTWVYDKHGGPTAHQVTNDAVKRAAECAELAALSAHVVTAALTSPHACVLAHDGTREGARAAWGFIYGHMLVEAGSAWERYRRELEAM